MSYYLRMETILWLSFHKNLRDAFPEMKCLSSEGHSVSVTDSFPENTRDFLTKVRDLRLSILEN